MVIKILNSLKFACVPFPRNRLVVSPRPVLTSAWLELRTSLWNSRVYLHNILISAFLLFESFVALSSSLDMAVRQRLCWRASCTLVCTGKRLPWFPGIWRYSMATRLPLTDPAPIICRRVETRSIFAWSMAVGGKSSCRRSWSWKVKSWTELFVYVLESSYNINRRPSTVIARIQLNWRTRRRFPYLWTHKFSYEVLNCVFLHCRHVVVWCSLAFILGGVRDSSGKLICITCTPKFISKTASTFLFVENYITTRQFKTRPIHRLWHIFFQQQTIYIAIGHIYFHFDIYFEIRIFI